MLNPLMTTQFLLTEGGGGMGMTIGPPPPFPKWKKFQFAKIFFKNELRTHFFLYFDTQHVICDFFIA